MTTLRRYAAPLATLALAAVMIGCPSNPTVPDTKPSPTKRPTADPTETPGTNPTATATIGGTTAPTTKPTGTTTPTTLPTGTGTPTTVPTGTTVPTTTPTATSAPAGSYTQVERLARPAINEGLIRDPNLMSLWNSVGPAVDATDAAKPIAENATGTLTALGNTTEQTQALFGALLPDVMRIDTTLTSGYVAPAGGDPSTLSNRSATKGIPIGGRMIKDDVVDATLWLIVPGGKPGAAAIPGLESDGVTYEANHDPLLADFPYLAEPN
jgi:hypothetical protein